MKQLKLSACLLISGLLAFTSYGQAPEKVILQNVGSGIMKLTYKTSGQDNVKVSIFDQSDKLVFSETINKTGSFVRPYNLAELESKDFKIVVEDKDGKTDKKFSYSVKKVESSFDVSKISNAKNKYLLSVENKEFDQVAVRILDKDGSVLHEQSIQVNGKFSIVFNLDKIKTNPTFEVSGSSGNVKTFAF